LIGCALEGTSRAVPPFGIGTIPALLWWVGQHTGNVKSSVRFVVAALWLGPFVLPAGAAFSSLYVFGDGVCTTTNGPGGPYYYGKRYCNGRVWVEVLAERQGLSYESNKNWSYYGHYSSQLVTNVNNFIAPADAGSALFIVWCADADFVWDVQNYGTNLSQWTAAMNQSLSNHFKAVTNLYHAKGARTVILPNAVDLAKVPFFSNNTNKNFIRQRTIEFNAAYATALLNQIQTNCPSIRMVVPDFFALFDDVVAHPAAYGLIKPDTFVFKDLPSSQWALNGPGTNYVFWDDLDPTAKFHAVVADVVQQLITPVRISALTSAGASNRLTIVNLPMGCDGLVDASTDLLGWAVAREFKGTNVTQTVDLPVAGPRAFYRLRFPFAWSWP
jgi:phospholipase/lecithinase/hemolysin